MVKIAILVATGWKGAGHKAPIPEDTPGVCLPLHLCPEPLLPIGNGRTILSRTVDMLWARDFARIYIVIGEPGCLYPSARARQGVARNTTEEQVAAGARQSPWTQERLNYVARLGTPILSENPDSGDYMDSYALALDTIGYDGWDRAWLQQADVLLSERLMDTILEIEGSASLFSLLPQHDIFQFGPEEGREFRQIIEPWRSKLVLPNGNLLTKVGFRIIPLKRKLPGLVDHWHDVDYTSSYGRLMVQGENKRPPWIERHGCTT